jgi:hypothetical protein
MNLNMEEKNRSIYEDKTCVDFHGTKYDFIDLGLRNTMMIRVD